MAGQVGSGYVDPTRPAGIWTRSDPPNVTIFRIQPDPPRGSTRPRNNSANGCPTSSVFTSARPTAQSLTPSTIRYGESCTSEVRLVGVLNGLKQNIIDLVVNVWRKGLKAYVGAQKRYFEHSLSACLTHTWNKRTYSINLVDRHRTPR